ncbi:LOW QUALITY PROTEIN: hypothetical protein V1477_005710 [Vespula maculifrons]|uniref:Uncharacterized protein n=1 Tax=Vespula maculifrons TaxID=7453 RepID=A0ABD2CLS1_VESMC
MIVIPPNMKTKKSHSYGILYYKAFFEWWYEETEYILLKGFKAALGRGYNGVLWKRLVEWLFTVANGI